jgi:hypothetical protein
MGFYIRKAFQFGPLRLNLSKGGLGISAGVKGLRIGTGPRGTYLHAGRGGLYVREYLSHHVPAREAPAPRLDRPPASASVASPELLEAPSSVPSPPHPEIAITPGPAPHMVDIQAKKYGSIIFVPLVFGGLFAFLALGAGQAVLAGVLAVAVVATALVLREADRQYAHRLSLYTTRLLALLKMKSPLPAWAIHAVIELRQTGHFRPDHLHALHYAAFRALLEAIMEDGIITGPEKQTIAQVEAILGLPLGEPRAAKLEAFKRHYLAAISDHELTEEEDARLQQFQAALEIPADAIHEELGMIVELREARRIREGELRQIPVEIALQDGEICYHRTTAQLLEKRVLRSYTVNRVRQKEEGLVPTKEGKLYITSTRLLLVGDGAVSFPFRKTLDVDVDPDAKQITITQDGRQRPVILAVPDAIITGAVIERAAREA